MIDLYKEYITKPNGIKELFQIIIKIVTELYNKNISNSVKYRKNKNTAKMSDAEIISIKLLIESMKKSENNGYNFLRTNFPDLVNYCDRSRFNRSINNLHGVIEKIRKEISKLMCNKDYAIVDSFPVPVCKFGRAKFTKSHRDIATYGYCASKKETYYGFKGHLLIDLEGNIIDYLLTSANVDDREGLIEIEQNTDILVTIGDKGYIGEIENHFNKKGKKLIAMKRKNSKQRLPKSLVKIIGKVRRRVETTISQLVELFDIERVRKTSKLGLKSNFESKILLYSILRLINKVIEYPKQGQIAYLLC